MGREKRGTRGSGPGGQAKERHKKNGREVDWSKPAPPGLKARLDVPNHKSKHQSYFEFVENKDKKKKLEFQITTSRQPPPGFVFVPIGNPELTTACKEKSRQQDAMIFIVSIPHRFNPNALSVHINRIGHHIRHTIYEQARAEIGDHGDSSDSPQQQDIPEPIPESQEEINRQADAAIRDLFPRIPNTDRQMIIERSFNKAMAIAKGSPLVGLAEDVTLSRRVQLAVLAHIRHTHTRYDRLLSETSWENARKTVETLCLDILVKWRGDEETGRDQLDEILREVVVISDSEDESSDGSRESDDSDDDSVQELTNPSVRESPRRTTAHPYVPKGQRKTRNRGRRKQRAKENLARGKEGAGSHQAQGTSSGSRRGFARYEAVRARWDQARDRARQAEPFDAGQLPDESTTSAAGHAAQAHQIRPAREVATVRYDVSSPEALSSRQVLERRDNSFLPVEDGMSHPLAPHVFDGHGSRPYHVTHASRIASSVPDRVREPTSDDFHLDGLMEIDAPHRVRISSEQLQDYLLPSIEPKSPGVGQSSVPIFIRTLPEERPRRPEGSLQGPQGLQTRYPIRSRILRNEDSPTSPYTPIEQVRDLDGRSMLELDRSRIAPRRSDSPVMVSRQPDGEFVPFRGPERGLYSRPETRRPSRQIVDHRGNILREDPHRPILVEEYVEHPERLIIVPTTSGESHPIRIRREDASYDSRGQFHIHSRSTEISSFHGDLHVQDHRGSRMTGYEPSREPAFPVEPARQGPATEWSVQHLESVPNLDARDTRPSHNIASARYFEEGGRGLSFPFQPSHHYPSAYHDDRSTLNQRAPEQAVVYTTAPAPHHTASFASASPHHWSQYDRQMCSHPQGPP